MSNVSLYRMSAAQRGAVAAGLIALIWIMIWVAIA